VEAKHDIQTASDFELPHFGLPWRRCACYLLHCGGWRHCATELAWQSVSATSYYMLLLLYVLVCAYPNSYDVCDSNCVAMVIVVARGSHSFLRIPRASRSPRRRPGLAKRSSSHHCPYERYLHFSLLSLFIFWSLEFLGKLQNFFGTLRALPENAKTFGFRYFFWYVTKFSGFGTLPSFSGNYQALLVNCAWPIVQLPCTMSMCSLTP